MRKILIAFLGIFIMIFLLMTSLKTTMYDMDFYTQEYEKNGVFERFGENETINVTENLFSYLQGKEVLSDFFNTKEKLHMVDVKRLVKISEVLFYSMIAHIFFLLIILYHHSKDRYIREASIGFIISGCLIILLALALYAFQGSFPQIFTNFHELFFDNDLWILNPATDNMIILFPEQFFNDIFYLIIMKTLVSGVAIGILGLILIFKHRKRV